MDDFAGLVAAVTGGAGGIGQATAEELSDRGAVVVLIDRVAPDNDRFALIECDITDDAALDAAVQAIDAAHGRLDVLVNNAGIGAAGGVDANDREEWHRVLDVNVVSAALLTAAALPLLRRSSHPAVVNLASIAATSGLRERVLYSASKGAVAAMTRAMAADLLAEGIRVNCVSPGTADTPWVQRLLDAADDPAAEEARLKARQPTGQLVSAHEVAFAIAYLASPRSSATYGVDLDVDNGVHTLRIT